MCGIAGIVHPDPGRQVDLESLGRMARALAHRGPDTSTVALDDGIGLVCTRLAIVDVAGSVQPAVGDQERSLLVYNGEVYNHNELRARMIAEGARFGTAGDTEVVLRLLERRRLAALSELNGQFAFAWWERRERRLTLVRDRFGVRPLHYAVVPDGTIVFASEAKALFASGLVDAAPDLAGVDETFSWWATSAPATAFRGVRQVRPGHHLISERGRAVERPWWEPRYGEACDARESDLLPLLEDSVRLRLGADVPVGCYLSGGLDSSLVAALATRATPDPLSAFSIAFSDRSHDERLSQRLVAEALGLRHHVLEIDAATIAASFEQTVWHAETPLVRSAPVPMYRLAQLARDQGISVVLSGEGADELFWGYDLFKEVKLRQSCAADPTSRLRPLLFDRLYPVSPGSPRRSPAFWRRSFLTSGSIDDPLFSHQARLRVTACVRRFYSPDVVHALAGNDPVERLRARLPEDFRHWSPLERAAYLEVTTLLTGYLLAAQGDRVSMAHGVEGRYPFLDHRVFEHSVRTRPDKKLRGLRDKAVLRRIARQVLPAAAAARPKHAYAAPDISPFVAPGRPRDWVDERLAPAALRRVGIFDEKLVTGLVRRCQNGRQPTYGEGMALVAVLSTQVWYQRFFESVCSPRFPAGEPAVRIDLRSAETFGRSR